MSEEPREPQSWPAWLIEVCACMVTALGLTFTLWIKRLVERAMEWRLVDRSVFHYGLAGPTTAQGTMAADNGTGNRTTNGSRAVREGPGTTWVESRRSGQRFRVPYDALYRDRDGNELYDHSVDLGDHHAWYCPLLKVDTACVSCDFYVNKGSYRYDPQCAAIHKLQTCPDSPFDTVRSMTWQMENS